MGLGRVRESKEVWTQRPEILLRVRMREERARPYDPRA